MPFFDVQRTVDRLLNSRIAIVGAGNLCVLFLRFISSPEFRKNRITLLGIADVNDEAPGMQIARERGVPTFTDYRKLFALEGLQMLLEMTDDPVLGQLLRQQIPDGIEVVDHFQGRAVSDFVLVALQRERGQRELKEKQHGPEEIRPVIERYYERLVQILERRNQRSYDIEMELVEKERTLSQIIQGSTIPTFVIDRNHRVTHWNKAVERLTGHEAEAMVGTGKQWSPFYGQQRPTMADAILDQVGEEEIRSLYANWRKSALIEGAYEAEGFFPSLGEDGKWCWFTAAPIKAPDGTLIGAIETLWDKTEDKRAEQEKERYTRLLEDTAAALAKSEETMKQIIQGSTIPTFVIDQGHRITHWNKAVERLTGLEAENMVGTGKQWSPFYGQQRPTMADVILDQVGEEEIRSLYANWRKSALIEGAYEAEGFFPKLGEDGKWCWFTAAPIKAPDGTIIGAIETLWDKTEDKLAEEEREQHTKELTALCSIYTALGAPWELHNRIHEAIRETQKFLDADSVCYFILDGDKQFRLLYNIGGTDRNCQEGMLADADSMVQRVTQSNQVTIFEHLPDDPVPEIRELNDAGYRSLAYIPLSAKESTAIGLIRLGSQTPGHFSSENRNVLELIGNRMGAAVENALLQEEVIKSEETYRSLFNNDPNPIFILDSTSREILDFNQRARDAYGYERDELVSTPFLRLGGDEEVEEGIRDLALGGSLLFTKKRHYRKDGSDFFVNLNVSRAQYGESDVLIATTTDITETVEKETQLIQASKMTTLGQMAAGIAHEINQPLNVIQVCADFLTKMLKRGNTISEEDLQSVAEDIGGNVQRASAIIQHMRDFSRQSEVVRRPVNLNEPIQDVFKVLGYQLKNHRVELDLNLAPDLPDILADHNRLEQVFINLVTNGLDAIEEKTSLAEYADAPRRIAIQTRVAAGEVVVSVSDTGIGMTEETRSKIFEPFYTTKEVGKGTGLGVSISYGIIKDYQGAIDVETEVGKGTTFHLRFPVAPKEKSSIHGQDPAH
ncbi:MAG: PAS domain S-box protein [Desulfobacteraceae bacterium]|nr:PAS domain S-box protein [Desulfobacteraceae bacterium]